MPSILLDGVASRLFSSRRLQNRFQIRYRWQGAKRPARVAPQTRSAKCIPSSVSDSFFNGW